MPPPPAPNRERLDRFAGNRAYFRDLTPLSRTRRALSLLGLAIPLVWVVVSLGLPAEDRHHQLTHGPVANVHAAWDNKCDACHVPSSLGDLSPGAVLSVNAVHDRWNAFSCETCHVGQQATDPKNYAPHHVNALWTKDKSNLSCSACHHDHQGRDFSLVRVVDNDCTQCHKELKNHQHEPSDADQASIQSFVDGHPDFKGVKTGFERTMHFNHQHHMTPGVAYSKQAIDNKTGGAMKLKDIPTEYRERYRQPGQGDDAIVQLNCASCHQLDSGRVGEKVPESFEADRKAWTATEWLAKGLPVDSVLPPRGEGAYFQAVNYNLNCKACHPMAGGKLPLRPDRPDLLIDLVQLPHGVQPKVLRQQMEASVVNQLLKATPAADKPVLPGRLDPLPVKKSDAIEKEAADFVRSFEKRLYQSANAGCLQCHTATGKANEPVIVKPNSPVLWYPHSKFNHARHRAMDCASCHPGQKGNIFGDSEVANQVDLRKPQPPNIPGIDNCTQCHAPATTVGELPRGGVRFDCVECHRYHNGDLPQQGIGSPRRDPPDNLRLNTDRFLRGR